MKSVPDVWAVIGRYQGNKKWWVDYLSKSREAARAELKDARRFGDDDAEYRIVRYTLSSKTTIGGLPA